ncbi:hypothetical protein ABVN80_16595 [Acinetobacter baumannii]
MHVGQYNSKKPFWHYLPERWASRLKCKGQFIFITDSRASIVFAVSLSLVYIQEKPYLETIIDAAAVPQLIYTVCKITPFYFLY